jgi:hypothetical protein
VKDARFEDAAVGIGGSKRSCGTRVMAARTFRKMHDAPVLARNQSGDHAARA